MADKRTMTLNLSEPEMAFVQGRAEFCEMSKTAVIRAALRLYQLVLIREAAGETLSWSGDRERLGLFIGPAFTAPTPESDPS